MVYDASLMLGLPVATSVASGLNALAHCVDSMWGPRTDPIDRALALEGIRALDAGLPRVVEDPSELGGREQTLYGAYLSAVAFASAGSGLHHKICHVLGGMFDLPHAETHAVVLPHVLALNAPAVPDLDARMAEAFGADSALAGLQRLCERVEAPRSLRALGLRQSDLAAAVGPIVEAAPPDNPVAVTAGVIEALLRGGLGRDGSAMTSHDAPRRVLVAGVSGAGKSTLARQIGARLGIEYVEIDGLYHGPGWEPRPAFLDDVAALVARDAWVTEWQYSSARPLTLARADLMVWLDLPTWRIMSQLTRRTVARRVRREELWNGNVEAPLHTILTDREHVLRWAWQTRHQYAGLDRRLAVERPGLPVVRLTTQAGARAWLGSLPAPRTGPSRTEGADHG